MRLATITGRSVAEAQAAIDSPEFSRWLAYAELFGWPDERADMRAAAGIVSGAGLNGVKLTLSAALDIVNPWGTLAEESTADSSTGLADKIRAFNAGLSAHRKGRGTT